MILKQIHTKTKRTCAQLTNLETKGKIIYQKQISNHDKPNYTAHQIQIIDSTHIKMIINVLVTIYDTSGNKQYIVKLGPNLLAEFEYPNNLTGSSVDLHNEYIIDSSMNWSFQVFASLSDIQLKATFYDNDGSLRLLNIKYRWAALQIWMSSC